MFKQLSKLMLLALGVLTVFAACSDDDSGTTPAPAPGPETYDNFTHFAGMKGYTNPIINGMKLNLDNNTGTIVDGFDNKTLFYTYVDQPVKTNNTQAVYKFGDAQFFGVEVLGTGDTRQLKFVFNKGTGDVSEFFTTSGTVTFDATKTVNTIPAVIDNFINLSAGTGYILPGGKSFSIVGGNVVDAGNHILFTYNNKLSDNKTHAVYQSTNVLDPNEFLGVELVNTASPRVIKFYVNGTASAPTYFASADDVVFTTEATTSLPELSFKENVAGKSYQLVITKLGTLTKLGDTTPTAGDILFNTKTYTVAEEKTSTTAVYKNPDADEYFGVEVDGAKLNFYFDNSTTATGAYWTDMANVKFASANGVLLATRTINGGFGVTDNSIPTATLTQANVKTNGAVSTVYKDNIAYTLADNETLDSGGTLFKNVINGKTVTTTSSNVTGTIVDNMISTSLQFIGDDVFLAVQDGVDAGFANVEFFKSNGDPISLVSSNQKVLCESYAIGAGSINDNDGFFIATLASNQAALSKVTVDGVQTGKNLYSDTKAMDPKSVVTIGTDVFIGGIMNATTPVINKMTAESVPSNITGNLPATTANIKLFAIGTALYVVSGEKLYKDNDPRDNIYVWTEVVGSVVSNAVTTSIVADETTVYFTRTDAMTEVYHVDTTANTVTKLAESDPVGEEAAIDPGVVALPGMGIFKVYVGDGSPEDLKYSNPMLYNKAYTMPL